MANRGLPLRGERPGGNRQSSETGGWVRGVADERNFRVRRQSSQDNSLGEVIERLERISRAMNPVLLYVAVSLVVLNLACVVNLIDWSHLSESPAATAVAPSNTGHGN